MFGKMLKGVCLISEMMTEHFLLPRECQPSSSSTQGCYVNISGDAKAQVLTGAEDSSWM